MLGVAVPARHSPYESRLLARNDDRDVARQENNVYLEYSTLLLQPCPLLCSIAVTSNTYIAIEDFLFF
eukprot:4392894-Amphidinium_carterae.3